MKKIFQNISIDSIWHGGIGIGTAPDGKKILVKWGILPGSVIDVIVVKSRADYYDCHVQQIHHIDPAYTGGEVVCPHYLFHPDRASMPAHKTWCWWCKRQIINYPAQLALKRSLIQELFDMQIPTPIPSPQIFGYRNKIEYSFGKYISHAQSIHQDRALGFHQQWQFSKIVDIDQCYLVDDTMRLLYRDIKALCISNGLSTYDQMKHTGTLRHLMMKQWHDGIMLVVSAYQHIDNTRYRFLESLKAYTDRISTCIVSYNNWLADTIYDRDTKNEILRWSWLIHQHLMIDGHTRVFEVWPQSFFQTNTQWAQLLFQTVSDMMMDTWWVLLDLYCGAGAVWLSLSHRFDSLVWVDIVESAITSARINADTNHISHALFYAWKAEKIIKDLSISPDTIIVDPPREWLHPDVIDFINTTPHKQLIYISCNPVTLARDTKLLDKTLMKIQPLDMFPHTHHVETIAIYG